MASSSGIGPMSQQYAAAATVPLIKSPSLYLPRPVELPNDIHPLPDDITAYALGLTNTNQFVYPFALEEHVLSLRPSPHDAIAQKRARNAEILHQREVEEEQREKEALHKVAPGYNPSAVLVPTSQSPKPLSKSPCNQQTTPHASVNSTTTSDPMDDLVSQLEEMETRR